MLSPDPDPVPPRRQRAPRPPPRLLSPPNEIDTPVELYQRALFNRLQYHILPMTNTRREPTLEADPILIALACEIVCPPRPGEAAAIYRLGISSIDTRSLCATHCLPELPTSIIETISLACHPIATSSDSEKFRYGELIGTPVQLDEEMAKEGNLAVVMKDICEVRQDSFEERSSWRCVPGQENVGRFGSLGLFPEEYLNRPIRMGLFILEGPKLCGIIADSNC